jgi:hypothetical protein
MIDHHVPYFGVIDDPTGIFQYWIGIDSGRDGSTCQYFGFDLMRHGSKSRVKRIRSVFGNGSIGEMVDGRTIIIVIARSTNILWRTSPI